MNLSKGLPSLFQPSAYGCSGLSIRALEHYGHTTEGHYLFHSWDHEVQDGRYRKAKIQSPQHLQIPEKESDFFK